MVKGYGKAKFVDKSMLNEAVDAILTGMQNLHDEQRKRIDKLEEKMDNRFDGTDMKLENIQEQIENIDDKVDANYKNTNGKIKAMKATSVSREEFEELRDEVHRLKKSFASS
jgi:hypothetical protein